MLCLGCHLLVSFGLKVPNGEAADTEMPGKSSSEDEPQGAAFSGGEALMGTLSDPLNKLIYKLYTGLCIIILSNPLLYIFQGRIPSWIWTVWLDQALVVLAMMKQPWQ